MRSPVPLALTLAAPLLGCFADPGTSTLGTSNGSTGEPATTSSTTATNGEPTSSSTNPTTDIPPATTGDTGDTVDPTSTGPVEPTSTGPLDNCQVAPECVANTVEDGAPCDSCGVLRRTCQPDCTWSPQTCELALETCQYWVLTPSAKEWQRVAADPNAALAPQETVLAAVGLEPQHKIYVLTASNYHVFSTQSQQWTEVGPLAAIFPQIAGLPLYHASGLTITPPDTIVTLVAGDQAFAYTFIAGPDTFKLDDIVPCCGEDWMGPNAPPNPTTAVRDGWGRFGDPEGWISGNVQVTCGLDDPTPIYAYSLSIGDGFVYPQDIGHCFEFFAPVPYEQFAPFSFPGAPPNALVGGAAFVDDLYIFRGE
jgi:hypothetical protein